MNPETSCAYCPAKIRWVTTASGRPMPVDATPLTVVILDRPRDGWRFNRRPWARVAQAYVPHFATCPHYPKKRQTVAEAERQFREINAQAVLGLEDPTTERYK
jgi:hypothetical protein